MDEPEIDANEIDTSLVAESAAKFMSSLDEDEISGKVLACGIVVCIESEDGEYTRVRTYCSDSMQYQQIGLFEAGLDVIKQYFRAEDGED